MSALDEMAELLASEIAGTECMCPACCAERIDRLRALTQRYREEGKTDG